MQQIGIPKPNFSKTIAEEKGSGTVVPQWLIHDCMEMGGAYEQRISDDCSSWNGGGECSALESLDGEECSSKSGDDMLYGEENELLCGSSEEAVAVSLTDGKDEKEPATTLIIKDDMDSMSQHTDKSPLF